jgi:hypothetical protein
VTILPEELVADESDDAAADDAFAALLARLSAQSVTKHFDAYADVPWDDPAFAIDRADPRWELSAESGLGATEWYRSLPQPTRAALGLDLIASKMKTGLDFESVLKRGLLEYAATLPNRAPEFRYAYHEVIEEAQHSLMFQEFVNRSGADPRGLDPVERAASRLIIRLGRRFPPLFFVFVLGGEDPIDYVQRRDLRSGRDLHPLLERIMRIHVTEEARHLSFARHYLKRAASRLGPVRRAALAVGAPMVLSVMAQMMLRPSGQIVRRYRIPREVIREAFVNDPAERAMALESMAKIRRLWSELGLAGPGYRRLWAVLGLWPAGGDGAHEEAAAVLESGP